MNISTSDLHLQAIRALQQWPFIPIVEKEHGLPSWLLLAVGSRETNLTNEVGDGGHGHGVWQLDDRSHAIPAGFDSDVHAQAEYAAVMLHNLLGLFPLDIALDHYNGGGSDAATTGGDYGPDVIERMKYLQSTIPYPLTGGIVPDLNPAWNGVVSGCSFNHPQYGQCAALVAKDGAVACFPPQSYCGGANGQTFFEGRTAATIRALSPYGYQIGDTGDPATGKQEWYSFVPK